MKKLIFVFAFLAIAALALAACQPAPPAETIVETVVVEKEAETVVETVEVEKEVVVTQVVEVAPEMPERYGAWVDRVVVSTFEQDQALPRLKAGVADIYADTLVDPDLFNEVEADDDLGAAVAVTGKSVDIHVNPAEFEEGYNPFTDAGLREALQYLLDREYAAKEIHGGLAYPKYVALSVNLPEYVNIIDTVKSLEGKYAYNPEVGKAKVAERMEAMGAELVDGKWVKDGEPVVVHFIIRTDLWKNKEIGDMFSDALEEAGFTVDRMYKTRDEASPLVFGGDPAAGEWNLYIGGWGSGGLARDESWVWGFFYTKLGLGVPLWQAYEVPEEPYGAAEKLWNGEFETLDERTDLMREATEFYTAWNTHMFVVELPGFQPYREGVHSAYDLAAGIGSSDLWPYTIRWDDQVGGTINFAQKSLYVEPWNPIAGSNWAYDQAIQAATNDKGVFLDPYTGLNRPQRIESAEVDVVEGTPVNKTLDWVTLNFVDQIDVPGDAWVDWDAENQQWITEEEMAAKAQSAKEKVDLANAKATELAGAVDFEAFDDTAAKAYLASLAQEYGLAELDVDAVFVDDAAAALVDKVAEIAAADDPAAALAEYGVSFLSEQDAATFEMAEKDPATAKMKTVVYYPEGMLETIKWHDGSNLSVADFVYNMIMTFDRGKSESPLYDEAAAQSVSAYLSHFKGVRIVSTDPLVIETYDDGTSQLDAENLVTTWWPQNAQAWHLLAIASLAEENGELAYSGDKADANGVEWTSFIAGPSLDVLSNYLEQATGESYIPFAAAMGDYLDAAEADARYANLKQFYDVYGHYWIGTGPFYLTEVDTTNKTAVLLRNEDYPDSAAKWAIFGQPMLADIEIDGAGQVVKGQDATFDVYVTFNDEPYPDANLEKVSYLVFDESGMLLTQGEAEEVEEGTFSVVIPGDATSSFTTGALKLQVVAVSNAVAVPGVGTSEFVAVEP